MVEQSKRLNLKNVLAIFEERKGGKVGKINKENFEAMIEDDRKCIGYWKGTYNILFCPVRNTKWWAVKIIHDTVKENFFFYYVIYEDYPIERVHEFRKLMEIGFKKI